MPPLPLQKFDSISRKDGSRSTDQQGNKLVCIRHARASQCTVNVTILTCILCETQVHKTRSWYGSLSRKSTASTSLQREAIASSPLKAGSTPDFHRYDLKRNGDTASLSGASQASVNAPSKPPNTTVDLPAASTKSNTISEGTEADQNMSGNAADAKNSGAGSSDGGGADADTPTSNAPPVADVPQRPSTSSGWLGGLFSRAPMPETSQPEANSTTQESSDPPKEVEPEQPAQEALAPVAEEEATSATASQRAASYLFYFWPNKAPLENGSDEGAKEAEAAPVTEDASMEDAPPADPEPASKPSAGSTWAFWSVSRPKPSEKGPKEPEGAETGEMAVLGEGSERHPKRTNSMEMSPEASARAGSSKEQLLKAKARDKARIGKKDKKARPQTMDLNEVPSRPQTPQLDAATKVDSPSKSKAKTPTTATKPTPPNLILPSFRGTYRMKENPSILKQIAALLLRTRQPPTKHVFLESDPPKIKKAIAIGVHGLFPAAYLRAMIGQPTGTSIKFANLCADSIQRWADTHECGDCVIEKVALEGEGKIETRVANLWNLLQNWMDHIKAADLVVIACHSQGVPVSVMLLEKLIESGAISSARVGICAMAGVNLGPFPEYKGSMGMLMGTAAELWEFASSESEVSKRYERALKSILRYGARITYVGSIDDQLVPIEVGGLNPTRADSMADLHAVRYLLPGEPPIHIPRHFHRRSNPCPRLHRPPCRVRMQAAEPGHLGPWPHPRTLSTPRRKSIRRRGALATVRGRPGI